MLGGRRRECETLDRLLDAVRAGEGRALVLRGEPGVGKTALLDHLAGQASGCRLARASGAEAEMELAFAGLHQLCAPMLDRLERLPDPQRDALRTAFGHRAGVAPDLLLVGVAVLSLLSDVAEDQPLVCVVDDAQWLDRASAQALAFAARRLAADSVAVVFAVRDPIGVLAGLPELTVEGLRDVDARALLASVISGRLDARVRDRIIAESRGNPLALLELPRELTAAEFAGGFAAPQAAPLESRIEDSFRRRLEALPEASRWLLLVAAAEPVGEPALVWRAAERIGIGVEAAHAPEVGGLVEFGARVRFRHPLVRSAVYRAASPADRYRVHDALAEATDPDVDPDRRAWHRAHATPAPDEVVAEELARSAGRAMARGGLAAAAALLARAVALTPDPARRGERALAGARAKTAAGAFEAALGLLAIAEAGPLDELQRARVDLLRGQIAFALSRGSDAPPLLLRAARRLEPLDPALARETYLDAFWAALFVGRMADGGGVREVAHAARSAPPPPGAARPADLLLDAMAVMFTEGYAAGAAPLKRAVSAFRTESMSSEEGLRWLRLAARSAADLWDDESWHVLSSLELQLARDAGALFLLPIALSTRVGVHLLAGELDAAASLLEELDAVTEATGIELAPYGAVALAAWRGREAEASVLIDATGEAVARRGEGVGLSLVHWARALLGNGLGRYEEALAAAEQASAYPDELLFSSWGLAELVEAAARTGSTERGRAALERLSAITRACGSDWGRGIEARSRALLSEGEAAERLYREAVERLGRTRARVELARAHLVYGEWLRRSRRRVDAREQLHSAHDLFTAMGVEAYAERAARELVATGETARRRAAGPTGQLTAQEYEVARLARDGLSNPEIGTRLFISPRTAEYHLRKVFAKLGISSRTALGEAMADGRLTALSVRDRSRRSGR